MNPGERIPGKFTRAGCERPSREAESLFVMKTRGCPSGTPGGG